MPITIDFTFSPCSLVCVKIPPIFLLLNIISFGFFIFRLILYTLLKTSNITSAISIVIPSNLSILQFAYKK